MPSERGLPGRRDRPGAQRHRVAPDTPDAGVAVGGGVEAALSSRLSLAVEAIYYHGLTVSSYETTRFVPIQAGAVVPIR